MNRLIMMIGAAAMLSAPSVAMADYVYYPNGYDPKGTAAVSSYGVMSASLEPRCCTSAVSDGSCPSRGMIIHIY